MTSNSVCCEAPKRSTMPKSTQHMRRLISVALIAVVATVSALFVPFSTPQSHADTSTTSDSYSAKGYYVDGELKEQTPDGFASSGYTVDAKSIYVSGPRWHTIRSKQNPVTYPNVSPSDIFDNWGVDVKVTQTSTGKSLTESEVVLWPAGNGSSAIVGVWVDGGKNQVTKISVTEQRHYYEFGESSDVTIDFADIEGKRGDNLFLLQKLGINLKDWNSGFTDNPAVSDYSEEANKDLTFTITKSGTSTRNSADATDDFFNGREGTYQVMVKASSTFDAGNGGTHGLTAEMPKPITVTLTNKAREEAKKAIADKLAEVKQMIADSENISDTQREDLNNRADKAAEDANTNIDAATSTDGINDRDKGIEELNKIKAEAEQTDKENLEKAKQEANDKLDKAAEEAKKVIDKLEHLSDEDKQKAKDDIDKTVTDAKKQIDAADTIKEVDNIVDKGIDSIHDRRDQAIVDDGKAGAIKELQQKAAEVDKRIEAKRYLTEEQKRQLHEQVASTLGEYIAKVNAATDLAGVNKAKQEGLDALDRIGADADRLDEEAARNDKQSQANLANTGANNTLTLSLMVAFTVAAVGLTLIRRRA